MYLYWHWGGWGKSKLIMTPTKRLPIRAVVGDEKTVPQLKGDILKIGGKKGLRTF